MTVHCLVDQLTPFKALDLSVQYLQRHADELTQRRMRALWGNSSTEETIQRGEASWGEAYYPFFAEEMFAPTVKSCIQHLKERPGPASLYQVIAGWWEEVDIPLDVIIPALAEGLERFPESILLHYQSGRAFFLASQQLSQQNLWEEAQRCRETALQDFSWVQQVDSSYCTEIISQQREMMARWERSEEGGSQPKNSVG